MRLFEEEIPSFSLKFSFQSNMAFMVAVFILSCALAWAIRDHRRRLLELASEEQEDRLAVPQHPGDPVRGLRHGVLLLAQPHEGG